MLTWPAFLLENICLFATKINACHLPVGRTVNVWRNKIKQSVLVCLATLVVLRLAVRNVSVCPIVRCKKRASIRNASIHVQAHVASMPNVEW